MWGTYSVMDKIIENLNDLIEYKNNKIACQELEIRELQASRRKALRELNYLKGKYDNVAIKIVIGECIDVVRKCYE